MECQPSEGHGAASPPWKHRPPKDTGAVSIPIFWSSCYKDDLILVLQHHTVMLQGTLAVIANEARKPCRSCWEST